MDAEKKKYRLNILSAVGDFMSRKRHNGKTATLREEKSRKTPPILRCASGKFLQTGKDGCLPFTEEIKDVTSGATRPNGNSKPENG